jgi:hypothetical protein
MSEARAGDVVAVVGHRVVDAPGSGEILEVRRRGSLTSLRVRWEDGRESVLFPGSDVVVSRVLDG